MFEDTGNSLWYRQPAACWQQALPLGNGRMGAMVWGGAISERIDLSESTFVSGEASDNNSQPGAAQAYRAARGALLARDYAAAEALAQGMTGRKLNYGTNLPAGSLYLDFDPGGPVEGYRRSLNLPEGVARVEYAPAGGECLREAFLSHPDGVLALRVTGSRGFTARYDPAGCPAAVGFDGGDMVAEVRAQEDIHSDGRTGVTLHLRLRALAQGGRVEAGEGCLHVRPAGQAVLLLAMNTDFAGGAFERSRGQIGAAAARPWGELLRRHAEDFGALMGRCTLELGPGPDLPADEWLARVRDGGEGSAALAALMFRYGRYLFLCSAREDSPLPAHLQGAWNDGVACRIGWTCDMHLDINTQMNYWPAHVTGLHECTLPLHRWLRDALMSSGRRTAGETYGLPGWVAHTVSNAWGFSAPGWSTWWGLHVTGGAWIATHLWEYWLHTGDRAFLRDTAYPVLRGAAEFFAGYLAKDGASGFLLPLPSDSPENGFLSGGKIYTLSEGATCDILMIRELFFLFEEACAELGVDDGLRREAAEKSKRLPPYRAGRHGQLQEWMEDFDEPIPNHRHTSHLLGLFPFAQITPEGEPALCAAARVSIERRLNAKEGWEDTGWARALLLLYAARLGDGEEAGRHVRSTQRTLTNDNLMVFHPPVAGAESNVYELDGNTGFTSGVAEMLLQSRGGTLLLLPALPQEWRDGDARGLCGRGGFVVDMQWRGGELVRAAVTGRPGAACLVVYRGRALYGGAPEGGVEIGVSAPEAE